MLDEEGHLLVKKKKKVDSEKVEAMLLAQLDQMTKKKAFEKMTSLLGISKTQYIALQHFEKFYITRQNHGINQIEKNQNVVLAKELFACWDQSRLGHISVNDLAENLISMGLALSKDQVLKLINQAGFKQKHNKKQ